ncbi:DUF2442 domain-containing protein [Gemmatimonadota bacterium]
MSRRVRVSSVVPTSGTLVRLCFTNGETREVDLAPYLRGPIFEAIRDDPEEFRTVGVDPELGTVVWPNGADIDPDVLYEGLVPAWRETEEPASR